MLAVILAATAVVLLNVYAAVLVILRAKVYGVALYRPMLLNIALSFLPVLVAVGVWGGLFALGTVVIELVSVPVEIKVGVVIVYLLMATAVWLLLFPNSVYLITELNFSHRGKDTPVPLWYDIVHTLTLTLSGLANAVVSLCLLQTLLALGLSASAEGAASSSSTLPAMSWVFAAAVMVLGAAGVYLGRYLRFNSWDVRHPVHLVRKLVAHLGEPGESAEATAFVATHTILVGLLYVPLMSLAWTSAATTPV